MRPFRVLTIDGGGMRGLYTSTYLETMCRRFSNGTTRDIGAGFDLIVGTSTGGILACGLADGVPIEEISNLYQEHGPSIFPRPTPDLKFEHGFTGVISSGWKLWNWDRDRKDWASSGQTALRTALRSVFHHRTIEQIWVERQIAVCIPSVNMSNHKPWVFKTPHLPSKDRDNKYPIVDVCLATSAAPILLPLAVTDVPDGKGYNVFADGGLWANNPTMVGMIEAMQLVEPDQSVEIVSIGTCAPPSGRVIEREDANWGLVDWKVGIEVVETSLDAQAAGFNFIAQQIAAHLKCPCKVIRLPTSAPSGQQVEHFALDRGDEMACKVLSDLGRNDAEMAHSLIEEGNSDLRPVGEIFKQLKEFS